MIEELRKHLVLRENVPYAILMNNENYIRLRRECFNPLTVVNFQKIPLFAGIPIIINENYTVKVVTEQQYLEIYKASK